MTTVSSVPLSIYDDGSVSETTPLHRLLCISYKTNIFTDLKEISMKLTSEQTSEIQKQENTRYDDCVSW